MEWPCPCACLPPLTQVATSRGQGAVNRQNSVMVQVLPNTRETRTVTTILPKQLQAIVLEWLYQLCELALNRIISFFAATARTLVQNKDN